jgi:hypothetical protein
VCRLIGAAGCALALISAAGTPTALAGTPYVDGISDQNLGLWAGSYLDSGGFTMPMGDLFTGAWVGSPPSHILYARFVTAPDAVAQGGLCEQNLTNWYRYVTQLHLIPVIAVWDVAEGGCADNGAPSATTYATDITQLLGYLDGLGVTVPYIEAWNEPNASGVSASLAASYWTAANTICQADGCTAIAGDMVDSADQGPQPYNPGCAPNLTYNTLALYEDQYVTALGAARPAIWGFHPYGAVNCEQATSATTFEAHLPNPPGQVWFTEVGTWECRLGQATPRGPTQQNADASFLVNTLMSPTSPTAPAHVFWYELAAVGYTQNCNKYADSALFEASTSPGPLTARPAALTVFGPDTSLAAAAGAPRDVTATQATFDGTITPGGLYDSSYYFEYGPTTAYGSQTPAVPVGPSLASEPVSATVTGLTPATPYHYQLVITDGGGVSRGDGDTVMQPVLVGATPTTVAAGGSVTVTWSGVSDPAATDWIGLYQPGAPDGSPLGGLFADSCIPVGSGVAAAASGSCTMTVPATGGTYELRLYGSAGSGLLTTSSPISVPTLSASRARVAFGNPLTVSWTNVANATGSDWIGLYRPGAPASAFLAGFYTDSCTATSSGAGVPAGSCRDTLPSTTGSYELRLYESPASGLLANSGPIVDVPPVPSLLSAPLLTGAARPVRDHAGLRLACSKGGWSNAPTGYAYRWLRSGARIAGATTSTYLLGRADVGTTVACAVVALNAGGSSAAARSTGLLVHSAPPDTVLLGESIDRSRASVTVRFRATGSSSGTRCALVRAATPAAAAARATPRYSMCRSPLLLIGLQAGSYVLRVRAVGPGGPDPTPATFRFTLR